VRAMTVIPGYPHTARVEVVPEPEPDEGAVLVSTELVGLCGTDAEVVAHGVGSPPPGAPSLVLGHEAIGRVLSAPPDCGLRVGDLVTGIVRLPDPLPCPACARGDWDLCSNGGYVEHGIRGCAGFGRERWRSDPAYLIPVPDSLDQRGVLVEPMSVLCKAFELARAMGGRSLRRPRRLLVTGAGPIGLLAAAAGVDAGMAVTVLDRVESGVKPELARRLGAKYTADLDAIGGVAHADVFTAATTEVEPFDVVMECTGAGTLTARAATALSQGGVMVLIGLAAHAGTPVDLGTVSAGLIRANAAIVGTVNAGRRHYAEAVELLDRLDPAWLDAMITRRLALANWAQGLERRDDDVKVVVTFTG